MSEEYTCSLNQEQYSKVEKLIEQAHSIDELVHNLNSLSDDIATDLLGGKFEIASSLEESKTKIKEGIYVPMGSSDKSVWKLDHIGGKTTEWFVEKTFYAGMMLENLNKIQFYGINSGKIKPILEKMAKMKYLKGSSKFKQFNLFKTEIVRGFDRDGVSEALDAIVAFQRAVDTIPEDKLKDVNLTECAGSVHKIIIQRVDKKGEDSKFGRLLVFKNSKSSVATIGSGVDEGLLGDSEDGYISREIFPEVDSKTPDELAETFNRLDVLENLKKILTKDFISESVRSIYNPSLRGYLKLRLLKDQDSIDSHVQSYIVERSKDETFLKMLDGVSLSGDIGFSETVGENFSSDDIFSDIIDELNPDGADSFLKITPSMDYLKQNNPECIIVRNAEVLDRILEKCGEFKGGKETANMFANIVSSFVVIISSKSQPEITEEQEDQIFADEIKNLEFANFADDLGISIETLNLAIREYNLGKYDKAHFVSPELQNIINEISNYYKADSERIIALGLVAFEGTADAVEFRNRKKWKLDFHKYYVEKLDFLLDKKIMDKIQPASSKKILQDNMAIIGEYLNSYYVKDLDGLNKILSENFELFGGKNGIFQVVLAGARIDDYIKGAFDESIYDKNITLYLRISGKKRESQMIFKELEFSDVINEIKNSNPEEGLSEENGGGEEKNELEQEFIDRMDTLIINIDESIDSLEKDINKCDISSCKNEDLEKLISRYSIVDSMFKNLDQLFLMIINPNSSAKFQKKMEALKNKYSGVSAKIVELEEKIEEIEKEKKEEIKKLIEEADSLIDNLDHDLDDVESSDDLGVFNNLKFTTKFSNIILKLNDVRFNIEKLSSSDIVIDDLYENLLDKVNKIGKELLAFSIPVDSETKMIPKWNEHLSPNDNAIMDSIEKIIMDNGGKLRGGFIFNEKQRAFLKKYKRTKKYVGSNGINLYTLLEKDQEEGVEKINDLLKEIEDKKLIPSDKRYGEIMRELVRIEKQQIYFEDNKLVLFPNFDIERKKAATEAKMYSAVYSALSSVANATWASYVFDGIESATDVDLLASDSLNLVLQGVYDQLAKEGLDYAFLASSLLENPNIISEIILGMFSDVVKKISVLATFDKNEIFKAYFGNEINSSKDWRWKFGATVTSLLIERFLPGKKGMKIDFKALKGKLKSIKSKRKRSGGGSASGSKFISKPIYTPSKSKKYRRYADNMRGNVAKMSAQTQLAKLLYSPDYYIPLQEALHKAYPDLPIRTVRVIISDMQEFVLTWDSREQIEFMFAITTLANAWHLKNVSSSNPVNSAAFEAMGIDVGDFYSFLGANPYDLIGLLQSQEMKDIMFGVRGISGGQHRAAIEKSVKL